MWSPVEYEYEEEIERDIADECDTENLRSFPYPSDSGENLKVQLYEKVKEQKWC